MRERVIGRCVLGVAGVLAGAGLVQAATVSWTGLGSTSPYLWSDPANWDIGVPQNGDDLVFPAGVTNRAAQNDLVGLVVGSISFPGAGYTLSGNAIDLNGNITQTVSGTGDNIISLNMNLLKDVTINVTGTYRLRPDGDISGSYGIIKEGSGTLRFSGSVVKTYSGDTVINGGIVDMVADLLPRGTGKGNVIINAGGTLQSNNSHITINGLSGNGTVVKVGSNTRVLTVGSGGASGNFAGTFTDANSRLSLTKVGAGTQILSGGGTIGATVTVSEGTLLVNGTYSGSMSNAANDWVVSAGAVLGGTGSVTMYDILGVSGTLAPGGVGAAGTLDVNAGRVKFFTGSTFAVELGGSLPGDGPGYYDQLNLLQAAPTDPDYLDSGVNLVVSLLGGFVPSASDVFYILTRADSAPFSAYFAGLPEGSALDVGGVTMFITYQANWTGDPATSTLTGGNDVALYVPEPASLGLMVLGAWMLLPRGRKA